MAVKSNQKSRRLELVRQHIKQVKIKTQEQILRFLQIQGFDVTQATVSRDIADLGLTKNKNGFYVLAKDEELRSIFKTLVTDISYSGNIVLVKTIEAAAQTVAKFVDSANINGIMGSVAGDDTIFFLVMENIPSRVVVKKLQELKT